MTTQLPNVTVGSITGVLEIVDDYKGKVDAARVAKDYDLDIDEFLPSVHAGELLGFVKVADGDIMLTDVGKKMLKASLRTRKAIFREQVLKTPIFMDVLGKLEKVGGRMKKDELADILGFKLWTHDTEEAVRTLINWGRHANVLSYDADTKDIVLLPSPPPK